MKISKRSISMLIMGSVLLAACDSVDEIADDDIVYEKAIGSNPHGSRLDGDTIYLALAGEKAIVGLDKDTFKEKFRWQLDAVPLDLIKMGENWLVSDFQDEALLELDGASGEVLRRWQVGKGSSLFAPKVIDGKAYVVSEFADQFTVF